MTTTPSTTPSEDQYLRAGQIVLIRFPFVDRAAAKKRPAVVVSSDAFHRERDDCLLLAITSRANAGGIPIARWKEAGLRKPSFLKPVLWTSVRSRCLRVLGELVPEDLQNLNLLVSWCFGLELAGDGL